MARGRKKPTIGRAAAAVLTKKAFGNEPAEGSTLNEAEYNAALRSYGMIYHPYRDGLKFLKEYLTEKENEELSSKIASIKSSVKPIVCWTARMLSRNVAIPDDNLAAFNDELKMLEEIEIEEEETSSKSRKDNTGEFLGNVDYYIDGVSQTLAGDKFREWIANSSFSGAKLTLMKSHIKEFSDSLMADLRYTIEDDKALRLNPKVTRKNEILRVTKVCNVLDDIMGILNAEHQSVKASRKPRKSRSASVEKKASAVQYQETDADTGLRSITPDKIVGAGGIVLYNTKYRMLSILYAEEGKTLDVKGQTMILNVDMEKSVCKRMKRNETVVQIAGAGKREFRRIFDAAKNDTQKIKSATTNNNTLILRVL